MPLYTTNRLTRYRDEEAGIDVLPDDVLLEIFYITSRHLPYPSQFARRKPSPIAISLVCSRWRRLSLRYPLMWTNIYMPVYPSSYISLYFSRSKTLEVDITLDTVGDESNGHEFFYIRHLPAISQLVKKNAGRIRSFSVHIQSLDKLRMFFGASQNEVATILKTLEVRMALTGGGSRTHDRPIFSDAPSLRSLKITQVPFRCLPPLGVNITHFDMDVEYSPSYDDLQKVMSSSPNLENLVIRRFTCCHITSGAHAKFSRRIQAPRLQFLSIDLNYNFESEVDGCICPISNLVTPNLKYLEVANLPGTCADLNEHFFRLTNNGADAPEMTVRLNCAQLKSCISFLEGLRQYTNLELTNITTDSLRKVFLMNNLGKISVDLNPSSVPDHTWAAMVPEDDDDIVASVVFYVPSSSSQHPHLLKTASTHHHISITNTPFPEGFIDANRWSFFTPVNDQWVYDDY